jgi:hypothetical protein
MAAPEWDYFHENYLHVGYFHPRYFAKAASGAQTVTPDPVDVALVVLAIQLPGFFRGSYVPILRRRRR